MDQELSQALREEDHLKAARIFLRQGHTALAYEYGVRAFVEDGGHRECLGNNPKCEGRVTCNDEGDTTFYRICVPETAKAAHQFLEIVRNSWDEPKPSWIPRRNPQNFRTNPLDEEERGLLRKIESGDESAILQLAYYWFRTGKGAAEPIPIPTYQIKHQGARADGTIELKIVNQHEIKVEARLQIQVGAYDGRILYILADYCDYDEGAWIPYKLGPNDQLVRSYVGRFESGRSGPSSGEEIEARNAESNIITPLVRNWVEEHPEALAAGRRYDLYHSVQKAYQELEKIKTHYQAAQRHLIFEVEQFLEKSKDFRRNPDLDLQEIFRQIQIKPSCGLWRRFLAVANRAGYDIRVSARIGGPSLFIGILEGIDDVEDYGCQLLLRQSERGGGTVFANEVKNVELIPRPILNRRY